MNNQKIITVIATIIIIGIGAFWGGMKYKENSLNLGGRNGAFGRAGGQQNSTFPRGRINMGGAAGEIISKDDESLTIKLRDGGSKIIFFKASTGITKTASGTPEDLAIGKQVVIIGKGEENGSIVAESIQIRANFSGTPPPPTK